MTRALLILAALALTANGGNFTGGVVRVVVHYIDLTAPGS